MKIFMLVLLLLVAAMAWQHFRYFEIRRSIVQDQQTILHSPGNFHVVTFLEVAPGAALIPEVSRLRREIETTGPGKIIYAGQAAFTVQSKQIGLRQWSAVILVEYPSREAYDSAARNPAYREALGAFVRTYSHGMKRSPLVNLMFPQLLLALRSIDIMKGNWTPDPFEPTPTSELDKSIGLWKERIAKLIELEPVNGEAAVVFNLMQPGDSKNQQANSSYSREMLSRMAALGHGTMHVGRAVTVEGKADFEEVAIVYYPGVKYFSELLKSRFYQGIIGNKQLADTVAVPTVPILSKL